MESNIERTEERLEVARAFAYRFPDAPGYLSVQDQKLNIEKEDIVKAGEVFGKDGWTRKTAWNGVFDWIMKVDGIAVVISDAEENEFDGTPVSSMRFPIQLKEGE